MEFSKDEMLKMYEKMLLGRRFEEKVIELINKGRTIGMFHLSIGQEAAQIGALSALRDDDYFVPTHRFHPGLAYRMDLKKLVAELMGRANGCNQGKAFTFHISSEDYKVLPVNGMLGCGVANAVGWAWALKQNKTDQVVLCVMGDGTTSEGTVHEAMNLASLYGCPIVFFIENNGLAVSTPTCKQYKVENLSDRAKAYGMPGITVDGDDVLKVREAVENAVALARKGQPGIVEAKTHRWRGHFEGDPQTYRSPEMVESVEKAMKNDPIKKLEKLLFEKNYITPDDAVTIDDKVKKEIEEAFEYALSSPFPTREQVLDYDQVYATNLGGDLL